MRHLKTQFFGLHQVANVTQGTGYFSQVSTYQLTPALSSALPIISQH